MSGVTSGARAVFPPPHSVVRHQVDPDVYYYDSDSAGQGPGRATENRLQAPSRKACMSRQVRRSVEEGHARLVAGSALHFASLAKRGVKRATRPRLCLLAHYSHGVAGQARHTVAVAPMQGRFESSRNMHSPRLPPDLFLHSLSNSPVLCTSPVLPLTRKRCLITGVNWLAFQQRKQHARCYMVWVQAPVIYTSVPGATDVTTLCSHACSFVNPARRDREAQLPPATLPPREPSARFYSSAVRSKPAGCCHSCGLLMPPAPQYHTQLPLSPPGRQDLRRGPRYTRHHPVRLQRRQPGPCQPTPPLAAAQVT